MAKTGQYRYYNDNSDLNYPKNLTYEKLVSGAWLDDSTRFTELEIEGPQGLGFFLNNTPTPIYLWEYKTELNNDTSGVSYWSLPEEVGNASPVYNIKFDAKSLSKIININESYGSSNGYKVIIINYTQMD
jgi:hypothetical protein